MLFRDAWGDQIDRKDLEALALEGYREGTLSLGKLTELPGLETTHGERRKPCGAFPTPCQPSREIHNVRNRSSPSCGFHRIPRLVQQRPDGLHEELHCTFLVSCEVLASREISE
jgi:hypothetical protein